MAINRKGKDCSGCTACQAVCPKNCISMVPDALGFKFPVVDHSQCIECGLCERSCPFNPIDAPDNVIESYACICIPDSERMDSSSGAAFVGISDYFLDRGGVVYGAGYGEGLVVRHLRAIDKDGRNKLRGSKYVQSDMETVIKFIIKDLKQGREVLFTGTPCQTAGVRSAIPKVLRDNLTLVDIICHGCPSPKVWEEYVRWFSKKNSISPDYMKFRDKKTVGWKAYTELFFDKSNVIKGGGDYISLFKKDIMLRESCGVCPWSSLHRPGDLTIGDLWGYEKYKPELNRGGLGVSLILTNTPEGVALLSKLDKYLSLERVELKYFMQRNLHRPTPINPKREEFVKDFETKGLVYVMKKYGDYGMKNKTRKLLRRIVGKVKRTLLK